MYIAIGQSKQNSTSHVQSIHYAYMHTYIRMYMFVLQGECGLHVSGCVCDAVPVCVVQCSGKVLVWFGCAAMQEQ